MTSFRESDHPRQTSGRFAEKPLSHPEITLSAARERADVEVPPADTPPSTHLLTDAAGYRTDPETTWRPYSHSEALWALDTRDETQNVSRQVFISPLTHPFIALPVYAPHPDADAPLLVTVSAHRSEYVIHEGHTVMSVRGTASVELEVHGDSAVYVITEVGAEVTCHAFDASTVTVKTSAGSNGKLVLHGTESIGTVTGDSTTFRFIAR
jgi:hypothetical protein